MPPARPLRRAERPRRDALHAKLPSWDDVRFFLAIHRAGSLSAAAGPLGVTQPTCGRRLDALEASLGVRLFDRLPIGLRVTDEGAALLGSAAVMEGAAREFALRASVSDADLAGVVRIATNDLFASVFVPRALLEVRRRYPAIGAQLVLGAGAADLLGREADLAIRFGPPTYRPSPGVLVARKLGEEPFVLYASESYLDRRGAPRDPGDLAEHDVVTYSGPHPAERWCASAFRRASVALSATSMHVTARAVEAGVGLGVLPVRAARTLAQLRPLSPPVARATAWLVVHPGLRRVPRVRVVLDVLAEVFAATRASSAG